MGRATTSRTSAVLAAVACVLVVCAGLAVVPGGADAQEGITGEVTFDEANGKLTVEVAVQGGENGSFTGDAEEVTIDIENETVGRYSDNPGENESTYAYSVGSDTLSGVEALDGQDGSGTSVTISYSGGASFSETVGIRYVVLGVNGGFDDGALRLNTADSQHFGVSDGGSVPVRINTSGDSRDVMATYEQNPMTNASSVVVDRGTLSDLGVLRQPQEVTVFGREYVGGSTSVDVAGEDKPGVTGERLSGGSGVAFESPLFESGETYVVRVDIDSSAGQYVRTVEAAAADDEPERIVQVDSAAVAAESTATLTVEHESTGATVYERESVRFTTASVTGDVSPDGTEISNISLQDGDYGADTDVWIQVGDGVERYNATPDVANGTLTFPDAGPAWPDRNRTGILIDRGGSPLYATVSLQSVDSVQATTGNGGFLSGLPRGLLALVGGALLGIVTVAGVVYVALSFFGSGKTRLNPLGGSSTSRSSAESPPAETAQVSFEVVDELTGRTYREADRVIARQKDGGRAGLGAGSGAVGSRNAGRSAGGPTGVNTGNGRSIGLSAGTGNAELDYGDWAFEVVERSRTVGKREHSLEYGFDSDHIGLSVTPHTVTVQVTEGPERSRAGRARVTATADVDGWSSREQTDREGRIEFEIPRSASRVTFTAETGTAQPVEADYRVDQAAQNGVTLAIGAETGSMAIETRVGERAWPEVDVQVTPISEEAKAYTSEEIATATTDSAGRREARNLPVGEYEVSAHPQLDGVETTAAVERVAVRDGATTDVTLSIGVSYSVPEAYSERIAELRGRIEELTAATNRDVAIPRYYGTVLTSVLDLVSVVESSPEHVVGEVTSPNAMIGAVLDATDAGITAVEGAMSERRTSSLLEACASMPPAEVAWSGEATLDEFLEQVAEGGEHDRRALRDRLEETDDVLDGMWGEVNEIAPARKVHDRVGELARETRGIDDELTVVARAYVGIYLLDAIEELFEHDALRERLNSGSY